MKALIRQIDFFCNIDPGRLQKSLGHELLQLSYLLSQINLAKLHPQISQIFSNNETAHGSNKAIGQVKLKISIQFEDSTADAKHLPE